ncbi:sugar transferase [Spirosoma fluviale]|uniref:Sugar transferase involved in LPS biosynthesis (Colanic, teichoic acid) n=1 Tax=Spirosoma fluviale TaxID=1597977 RepID=A0A286GCB3_9BACT|nr:sugar transferase [Spirosoma fluviale]SOD93152.1 Sugar transferase involved in LPS biosynthesis (colanic, teichoic acid) [Spirosoma fluviale]
MKTYGISLTKSKFLIVYLDSDTAIPASFIETFSPQATIICFTSAEMAWSWIQVGNRADLIIANVDVGGLSVLEKLRSEKIVPTPPVILITKTITTQLQEKARRLVALDVFSIVSDIDKLNLRVDYLIQKAAYLHSAARWETVDLPELTIPIWKRVLDISVSLAVLIALSPVLLVAAILVFIDHPGPVFYSSKRVGKDYKVFDMYKFRSMRPNADKLIADMSAHNIYNTAETAPTDNSRCENCTRAGIPCQQPLFLKEQLICEREYVNAKKAKAMFSKFRNDPRVTPIGAFLRNTSIDELPQLFNIIRGDMSLVGNRPLPIYEAERLTTSGHVQRFAAPAGLTGLWQVTKRGKSKGVMSDHERIQLDIQYAEKFSFRTDMTIMLRTVTAVFQQENV